MTRREYQGLTEQRGAALKRLMDARVLLHAGREHHRGAMYIAGYAVECRLKVIAMETYGCWTLEQLADLWEVEGQEVYTHGLETMAKRLPLWTALRSSGDVWRCFASRVNTWRVSWRYDGRIVSDPQEASYFIDAVEQVYNWLGSYTR